MAISKKLEIIYHNGQPDGIRSIRRHLSTMTTYVIPRPLLSEAKKLTGINRPGIYYLISETDDNKIAQIYVGQTRNGVSRLDDHNRSKDFWNKAIMFLADNKTFSLDMISGLEAFAIGKAIDSKRYKVENTVNPKYEIDEYDLPLIEEVYEEIKFIMATQGYKMENTKTTLNDANMLHTTRNGIQALGVYDGEKFEVLEGSEIDMSRKCHSDNIEKQRRTAIQNGDIVLNGDKYILNVSVPFTSPSSAAMFVLGGSTNGYAAPAIRNAMIDYIRSQSVSFEAKNLNSIISLDELAKDEFRSRHNYIADPTRQTPEQIYLAQERIDDIHHALYMIEDREEQYLRYRFGFDDDMEHPLTETSKHFHLSEGRAKKTEALALDNVWLELPWWY